MAKEGVTRMVTFKQDVGEKVNYADKLAGETCQAKEQELQNFRVNKRPLRQVLERSQDKK